jgi:PII-like signaling protein
MSWGKARKLQGRHEPAAENVLYSSATIAGPERQFTWVGGVMHLPQDAIFLRAFIGEADRADGHALYRAIVEAARAAGLAGATVLHGPLSFGPNRRINSEFLVEAPGNLPMVVEIVDTEDRIHAFLPRLEQLVGSGLVTLEALRMFRCGRQTHGLAAHQT